MNAIAVHNLGKKFKLFTSPSGRFLEYMSIGKVKRHEDFWALKDISFDIPTGTTLGILGQNGSGKSTLLSILAGVLYPSAGSFEIKGKVSAILELGSGFHPEFSGKDNVYMYGSIMGLSKLEIDTRFEEIVQFSELGDFINQPLRTYSSGMIIRLAFSVAVHVDADILIVDEALAVGDAIFQHRCFRKIREMQSNGKTILYVGHDTEAVRNLCTQALLLDGGRIIERGDPNYVVNKYYALIAEREQAYSEGNLTEHGKIPGEGYETVYSFVQNLNTAKVIAPPTIPVCEQTIEINSSPRKVIFAHPPSEINYSVLVQPRSSLAFAIGIMPGAWDKIPQGVKFDIEILCDGNLENIFSRVLQPKRNIGDRGWHNFIEPLERYSGKTVTITFITTGSGDDLSYGWSAWGWGKIIQIAKKFDTDKVSLKEGLDTKNNKGLTDSSEMLTDIQYGNKKAEIRNVELLDKDGSSKLSFQSGEKIIIRYKMFAHQDFADCLTIGFIIRSKFTEIYGTHTRWQNCDLCGVKKGDMPFVNICMPLPFGSGTYSLTSAIAIIHPGFEVEVLDRLEDHLIFHVKNDQKMIGIIDLNAKITIE
jgi:ABC-type polysaccharide/polyol phosphate transport system ATPase subunit